MSMILFCFINCPECHFVEGRVETSEMNKWIHITLFISFRVATVNKTALCFPYLCNNASPSVSFFISYLSASCYYMLNSETGPVENCLDNSLHKQMRKRKKERFPHWIHFILLLTQLPVIKGEPSVQIMGEWQAKSKCCWWLVKMDK